MYHQRNVCATDFQLLEVSLYFDKFKLLVEKPKILMTIMHCISLIKITQPPPFFSFLHFENLEKHKGPRILKNMTFLIQLYTKNERENVIFTSLDNSFCEIKQNS